MSKKNTVDVNINGVKHAIPLNELADTAEIDQILALYKSRLKISDFMDIFDIDDILNKIPVSEVCNFYGEDEILDFLEYPHELTDPMECLEGFKQLVSPRTYCDKEDLKKLVCDWIDNNMTHSIK